MNRILTGIDRAQAAINAKNLSPEKLAETSKAMDMDIAEYCRFQTLKSLASQDGRLSLDEAQTVYGFLGNTPEHFNSQSLAAKYVLTQVFASLLKH